MNTRITHGHRARISPLEWLALHVQVLEQRPDYMEVLHELKGCGQRVVNLPTRLWIEQRLQQARRVARIRRQGGAA